VIHEIDESLRNLVRRDLPSIGDAEVVFDAPTKEWASRRSGPTIDVYLYDIREDMRRRQLGRVDLHDDEGHTVAHRVPPRFFKLSYLLTAWTQRPEDEHRLLSELLTCFLRNDALAVDDQVGELAAQGVPLPMTLAVPPPEDRALSDVWSALGGELKPSLDLVVIALWAPDRARDAAPPVQHLPIVDLQDPDPGSGRLRRPAPAESS
jgi:hypothetical protein